MAWWYFTNLEEEPVVAIRVFENVKQRIMLYPLTEEWRWNRGECKEIYRWVYCNEHQPNGMQILWKLDLWLLLSLWRRLVSGQSVVSQSPAMCDNHNRETVHICYRKRPWVECLSYRILTVPSTLGATCATQGYMFSLVMCFLSLLGHPWSPKQPTPEQKLGETLV